MLVVWVVCGVVVLFLFVVDVAFDVCKCLIVYVLSFLLLFDYY